MKTITLEMLKQENACPDQIKLFRKVFGKEARITQANAKEAIKAGLQVSWLEGFLSASAKAKYSKVRDTALAEYSKVRDTALDEYYKVLDTALAKYYKVCASALVKALREDGK